MDILEISRTTGIPPSTVERLLRRAIMKIQRHPQAAQLLQYFREFKEEQDRRRYLYHGEDNG